MERKLRDARRMLQEMSIGETNYRIECFTEELEGDYISDDEMEEYNLLIAERDILLTSGVGEQIDSMIVVLDGMISRKMIERRSKMDFPQDHWGGYDENGSF